MPRLPDIDPTQRGLHGMPDRGRLGASRRPAIGASPSSSEIADRLRGVGGGTPPASSPHATSAIEGFPPSPTRPGDLVRRSDLGGDPPPDPDASHRRRPSGDDAAEPAAAPRQQDVRGRRHVSIEATHDEPASEPDTDLTARRRNIRETAQQTDAASDGDPRLPRDETSETIAQMVARERVARAARAEEGEIEVPSPPSVDRLQEGLHAGIPPSPLIFPDGRVVELASDDLTPAQVQGLVARWGDAWMELEGDRIANPYATLATLAEHTDRQLAPSVHNTISAEIQPDPPSGADHTARMNTILSNVYMLRYVLRPYEGLVSDAELNRLAETAIATLYSHTHEITSPSIAGQYSEPLPFNIQAAVASEIAGYPVEGILLPKHLPDLLYVIGPREQYPDGIPQSQINSHARNFAYAFQFPRRASISSLIAKIYGVQPPAPGETAVQTKRLAPLTETQSIQAFDHIREAAATPEPRRRISNLRAYTLKYLSEALLADPDPSLRQQLQLARFPGLEAKLRRIIADHQAAGKQERLTLTDSKVGDLLELSSKRIHQLRAPIERWIREKLAEEG